MAYIRYNPNEPGDRERAYGEFFLGFILLWGSVGSVGYYIYSLVSLFMGNYSENILYSTGLLIVMAIIVFFIVFSKFKGDRKKEAAKSYFLFFFGGTIDLAGVIAIVVAICYLCYQGTGTILLICSALAVLIITFAVIMIYRKIEGYGLLSIKLFTDKDLSAAIKQASTGKPEPAAVKSVSQSVLQEAQESNYFFCHKCGKKLPEDSEFCSSCGVKLK